MSLQDPHSACEPGSPAIRDIRFDLDLDFERHVISGSAEYAFAAPLGDSLKLDLRDLDIQQVTRTGGSAVGITWSVEPGKFGQTLVIRGVKGEKALRIRFATSPEATALQWLAPEQTAGGKHPYMYSQCQAIHARSVFPCQDTPSVRFTFEAVLRVPHGLTAVMAALPQETSRENGKGVFRFRMPHPVPSYLFALAAGNIASESIGPRSRVYAEPEIVKDAAWEYADAERMIAEAEKLFGEYVWDKFDLLVMPPSFPYGGMENPTLTFLTPTLIAGDRSLVGVVAHELAHSWTGNLVTNATWEDFWLNEGWTVYAERRILERLYGADHMNLQAVNGRNDLTTSFKNFGPKSPYSKLKTDLAGVDPDDVFSSVPYEKGFLLLIAIERVVGRDAFDRFIRMYIRDHAFTSLTTAQFVEYLNRHLPGAAAKVGLDAWLYEPELPADSPTFSSPLIDDVRSVRATWDQGKRDLSASIARWDVHQKVLFLDELVPPLSAEDCAALESLFGVRSTRNTEILCPYLSLAAASAYEAALPLIRDFVGHVGRGKYLRPIYRALHSNPAMKQHALDFFDQFQGRYHSVARAAVKRILTS